MINPLRDLVTWPPRRPGPPVQAWLLHVLIVIVTAWLTEWLTPERDHARRQFGGFGNSLVSALATWDSGWYLRIAAEGYARPSATAFFPFYPLLIRLVAEIARVSLPVAGLLVSNLAFLGALLILHRLVRDRYGVEIASRTVWLLAFTPFAFFFSTVYSESLFLFLSLAAIALARDGRWSAAAVALFLVTLTRSAGVFVVVPMLFALIEQRGFAWRRLLKPGLQLVAGLGGFVVYAAHLERRWNDPLLMVSIQSEWDRSFAWPWVTLWRAVKEVGSNIIKPRAECVDLIRQGSYAECLELTGLGSGKLADDLALISVAMAIPLLLVAARWMKRDESVYALLLMVFPMFNPIAHASLVSMPRYLMVAWPLFVALAMLLRRRAWYQATLFTGGALMIWLLTLYARSYFVS